MSSRTPGRYLLHILAHPHIRLKAVNSELGIISYMYTVPEHSCAARSTSALCHAADSFCTRELYLRTTHCECAPCIDSLFLSTCPRGVLCSALPCAAIPMRHQCYALSYVCHKFTPVPGFSYLSIPPPCLWFASPCIFSETLMFTSKNFATHRSRQTDSPLFSSPSR